MAEPRRKPTAAAKPAPEAKLDVSAQLLNLRAGLYAVELGAMRTSRTESGMVLPCARIDALPAAAAAVHISTLGPTQLLLPGLPAAFIRASGEAAVLVTIYKLSGPTPPPELRIKFLAGATGSPDVPNDNEPSLPLTLSVHTERHGDVACAGGAWAGAPKGDSAIEGFSLQLGGELPVDAVEYQAILGRDWASPWVTGPGFCGSRGLALPLIGLRIRLRDTFARTHAVLIWGRFAQAGELGPFEDGAVCESSEDTLVGLRISLCARPSMGGAGAAGVKRP
jgi:hypothetical protein